ncbi:hypothetical protein [Escherichia coli]|uniref:hypothetical protein n=1 Tax=Escherichia coli TaxID=562 RepID=UPI000D54716B|nr:phage antirepressor KilAC domain protein [Escherichia coli]
MKLGILEKLEDSYFRQKEQQPVAIPQTLPEALRLAAELAEQNAVGTTAGGRSP